MKANFSDKIMVRQFGRLPGGESVEEYTLTNAPGMKLKVITYGSIINELHVPNRHGLFADVVLGFNDLSGYLGEHPYFGAIIGRVAGRITGGGFGLDGRRYQLAVNNPPNHLHGGAVGFDKRLWHAEVVTDAGGLPRIKLTYRSRNGEEAYPGNVEVVVNYSLTYANELVINYEAVTDQATPLNLTNHSYFNLAGEGNGTIENHLLQIRSSEVVLTDEQFTLTGVRSPVAGKANDFNRSKRLGDAIPFLESMHGDNYRIAHPAKRTLKHIARLEDPASGRVMDTFTTEEYVQLYTAAYLNGPLVGKSGRPYMKFSGLCLECQGYPNGVNHPELGNIILRPGEIYQQTTIYRFQTA